MSGESFVQSVYKFIARESALPPLVDDGVDKNDVLRDSPLGGMKVRKEFWDKS